jgi:hypothetical protein
MTDATPVPYEPVPPSRLRVGDTERFQAATALGEHFAAGRLDQDEYDQRVRDAYAARTRADLERLFPDLPEPAPFRSPADAGWAAGRVARDRVAGDRLALDRHRPARRLPVPSVLLVIAIFVAVSLVVRFPVFPLLLLLWFGVGRRAWR